MKRIVLFFIAFLLFLSTVEAQQSLCDYKDFTPYEKQRSDLAGEAGKKAYDALSDSDKLAFSISMLTTANNAKNDYEIMIGIENMLCTMFGVASLTNPENANSYYEYRMTNQMKTIAKWYFDERAKIEKQKTQLDIAREKERLSGFYALQQDVKSAFLEWSEKGTYEKREQYLMRIQLKSISAFDSICQKLCMEHYFDNAKFKILPYDVDNELYSIDIYYKVDNQKTSSVILSTKIGTKEAKDYKDEHYFTYMSDSRWCPISLYLHDGFLHSKELVDLELAYSYNADFKSNDAVAISYDELAIDNLDLDETLKGHTFNYNEYMTVKLKEIDSIHQITSKIGKKFENLNNLIGNGPWGSRDRLHGEFSYYNCVYYNPIKYINKPSELRFWFNEILDYETKTINYIRNELCVYRPLFDSDDDFVEFFFNETGVSENALKQLIKSKFDELTATINNVKELKGAKDTQKGKKMLEFCAMADKRESYTQQFLRLMGDYTYQLLKEFVLQNKVLKRRYESGHSGYFYRYSATDVLTRYVKYGG